MEGISERNSGQLRDTEGILRPSIQLGGNDEEERKTRGSIDC